MGMKGKKSKSKRVTLKQKSKVIKKVKEHHKKKAKEARKLGFNKNPKADKDAGIPPNREQELRVLEAKRAQIMEGLEQKKAANKERAKKRKLGSENCDITELADIASTRQRNFVDVNDIDDGSTSGIVRDNSERAFYKELVKVVDASDVILEVLDARDPLGTRCVDMERMAFKAGADKHLVLLLNKIDLVPREAVEKWLKYLREELPAVAFKCSTQEQKSNLGWKSAPKASKSSNLLQTSDCLGAETLIKLLKNYSRSHDIKKSITVGVIGLPNVGKSSLINSLKRCQVVNVGATPGLTRSMQEVHLDKNIKLLDCPGVVMLRSVGNEASVALRNCKRIEKLEDPVGPVKEILKLCPAKMLAPLYKLPNFDTVDDFLHKVATARGKLKKGGIVDIGAAARIVLHDWNEGKIPYYTMPPTRTQAEPTEARIVTELAKVFNIDEVYNTESSFIGSLKSTNDVNHVELAPNGPLNFDETMLEDNVEAKPSTQGSEMSDLGDGDETMASEEEEDAGEIKARTAGTRQNEKLYAEEGMLNTRLKKAEKKKRKKAKLLLAAASSNAMEDDKEEHEDFEDDYSKNTTDSAMDVGDSSSGKSGVSNQTRFDLLSSVAENDED